MREVFVILPSQGMDSLSLTGSSQDSQELLTAWTCAYHPEVLRLTRKAANPLYGLYVYDEPENAILITPKPSIEILDPYWMDRAEDRNCVFLKECGDLESLTAELLRVLREDAEKDAEKAAADAAKAAGDAQQTQDAQVHEVPDAIPGTAAASETSTVFCGKLLSDAVESADPKMPKVLDFMALGMMHLLSEIMAHKLQFMSYLDSFSFVKDLLSVLDAMEAGDSDSAHRLMQSAWDQLIQSRQYYAPQDGFLFDLALLDTAYLPETFQQEAESAAALNVLADGATITKMAREFPAMLEALKKGIDSKKICLVGGEETETEFPLLTQDGIVRRLQHGLSVYENQLGKRPEIFARRRFGLTPLLPNILKRLGFLGALHFTLDDGKFPVTEQSRIAWKGLDAQTIESVSKIPLDAQKADSISGIAEKLAKSLNIDNAFGAVFTHWAGEEMTSPWFRLLKRACGWIPLFGNLTTFTECFDSTKYSSTDEKFPAERYVSPYLTQMVAGKEADPISRWTRYHQLRTRLEALRGLESLAVWFGVETPPSSNAASSNSASPANSQTASTAENLLERLDSMPVTTKDFFVAAWQEMLSAERRTAEQIADVLADGSRKNALLLLNPCSFSSPRTTDLSEAEKLLSVPRLVPEVAGCVKKHFWERNATSARTPVHAAQTEVPPLGFAILTDSPSQPAAPADAPKPRRWFFAGNSSSQPLPPPVYQDRESGMWVMTNEHLTLRFDPYTGHLRSVYDNLHRGNRFSQQLAIRLKSSQLDSLAEENPEEYSIMAADSCKPGIFPDRCELEVSGRLMNRKGEILARFSQTTTLRRGSSIVEFDVFLDPKKDLGRNPWQSYCASRLAWGDSTVDLFRNVGLTTQPTNAFRLEAPFFVDVRPIHYSATTRIVSSVTHELAQRVRGAELRSEDFLPERDSETEYSDARLTLLANGLPWHRNCGNRRIDTLLLVQGETARKFRFGVAVNSPYPVQTALRFMTPITQTPIARAVTASTASTANPSGATSNPSGWLGHVSHRNVIITHWQAESDGARIRFAETEGRQVRATFRAPRSLKLAEQIDFQGERLNTLMIEGDQVSFEMFAFEFKEFRFTFE